MLKRTWPSALPEQAQAVRAVLDAFETPVSPGDVAAVFGRRTTKRFADVTGLLDTLVVLGQAHRGEDGRYVGVGGGTRNGTHDTLSLLLKLSLWHNTREGMS